MESIDYTLLATNGHEHELWDCAKQRPMQTFWICMPERDSNPNAS